MPLLLKTNNFLGSKDNKCICGHIELPLITIVKLDETLNQNNNKIGQQNELNMWENIMCNQDLQ
jgi:hypothetical protein